MRSARGCRIRIVSGIDARHPLSEMGIALGHAMAELIDWSFMRLDALGEAAGRECDFTETLGCSAIFRPGLRSVESG